MKQSADTRKPYSGPVRSLVIALDVGTTFSGVSYAILEPGEIPKIHGVTRFPGQEHVAGNSKIPSIMYYDKAGRMMAAGAEADTTSMMSLAEDEEWIKTELFKLRLRPRTMKLNMNGMHLGPLPYHKSAVHVFADFLGYLYQCTRSFITDTHANGSALWKAVEHDIQFVLSHPNGWEGAQQTKMRRAAVYGGLIPDSNEGRARIRFVTEGEASLHACVLNGLASDVLSKDTKHGFLIADAGGGTLDISSYVVQAQHPLVIEEVAPPDCIFAGSVFVSRRAREFLKEKLKNSKYGTPDSLDHITKRFDETTKRLFRDKKNSQFIGFGSPLDKDSAVGIRSGQLKLTGEEVAELFEPSIQAAVSAIKAQIDASKGNIKSVFLVGGYAASSWLFTQLQERLSKYKVAVSRPDTQTSKAVADGAIGFYCDHHVSARMAKFTYGVEYLRAYDPKDPSHVARKDRLTELPSGPKLLADAFDCILGRGTKVKESTVFTRKYCTELTNLSMLSVFEVEIWCFRGGDKIPLWIERQAENFSTLCLVRADLSPLSGIVETKVARDGRKYWTIVFSIEIHFGLTEFKARIKWLDNGTIKYGPASIIYNERGHRAEEDEPDSNPEDDNELERRRSVAGAHSRAHSTDTRRSHRSEASHAKSAASAHSPRIPDVVHAPSSGAQTPMDENRARGMESRTSSITSRGRTKDKGKERERDVPSETGHTTDGLSTRSSSRLGETLSSVWGADNPSPGAKSSHSVRSRLSSVSEAPPAQSPPPPPPAADLARSMGLAPSLSSRRSTSSRTEAPPTSSPSVSHSVSGSRKSSGSTVQSPKSSASVVQSPKVASNPPAPAAATASRARSPVIAPLSPSNMLSSGNPWDPPTNAEADKTGEEGSSTLFSGGGGFLSGLSGLAANAAESTGGYGILGGLWGGSKGGSGKSQTGTPKAVEPEPARASKVGTPKSSATPRVSGTPKVETSAIPGAFPSTEPSSSPKPSLKPEVAASNSKQSTPRSEGLSLDEYIGGSKPPAKSNAGSKHATPRSEGVPLEGEGEGGSKSPKPASAIPRSIVGTPKASPKVPSSPLSRSTFPSPKAASSSPLAQDPVPEAPVVTETIPEASEPPPPAPEPEPVIPEAAPAPEPEPEPSTPLKKGKKALKGGAKSKQATPAPTPAELPKSKPATPAPTPADLPKSKAATPAVVAADLPKSKAGTPATSTAELPTQSTPAPVASELLAPKSKPSTPAVIAGDLPGAKSKTSTPAVVSTDLPGAKSKTSTPALVAAELPATKSKPSTPALTPAALPAADTPKVEETKENEPTQAAEPVVPSPKPEVKEVEAVAAPEASAPEPPAETATTEPTPAVAETTTVDTPAAPEPTSTVETPAADAEAPAPVVADATPPEVPPPETAAAPAEGEGAAKEAGADEAAAAGAKSPLKVNTELPAATSDQPASSVPVTATAEGGEEEDKDDWGAKKGPKGKKGKKKGKK